MEAADSSPLAFWTTGPGQGELRPTEMDGCHAQSPADLQHSVRVRALYSGISRGTETLVFNGQVPESQYRVMRAPFQQGNFPFPVKYGYASVGEVVEGPAHLSGQTVFCLYPHQTEYRVPTEAVVPVPSTVPARRAILGANMETAVNGLWDSRATVGERIAVVGCGTIGLLVAWLASRIPGTRVTAIDTNPERARVAKTLGIDFSDREQRDDHDLVIHASGQPAGLQAALGLAGPEGRIVEMSWYGNRQVPLALGENFHSRRLSLFSSQVGTISPQQRPRWAFRDRLALALSLLDDPAPEALITGESTFQALPATMAALASGESPDELCHCVTYQQ